MYKKIGIIVDNLGASQKSFEIINAANSFTETNTDCCIIFQNEYIPSCVKPNICCLNSSEIWGYNGCIVSNCLETTRLSLKASSNGPRIFYIWDIFWLRRGQEIYDHNIDILIEPSLLLCCRSNSHANMIENYCNRRPLVTHFDINLLLDYGYKYGSYNKTIPEWISKIPGI